MNSGLVERKPGMRSMPYEPTPRRACSACRFPFASVRRSWPLLAVLAAVLVGAALRLAWGQDIEYKIDETWTFEESRKADLTHLPAVGMPTSVGLPNPGLSLWAFVLLQRLSGADDPPALARTVQIVNVAALVLLVCFVWRCVGPGEREAWLWAAALVSVNPLAVLFHRKLWPPCLLPLWTVAMLYGWWHRDRRLPAFLWGLVGACLGQFHLSGLFFFAAFSLWALLLARRPVAWRAWLCGSVLGSLPLVPWLLYLWSHPTGRSVTNSGWVHAVEGKFWLRWLSESFGFGIDYTLEQHFPDFLARPLLAGQPTYLIGLLHAVLAVAALVILFRAACRLWPVRKSLRSWIDYSCPTAFTLGAALLGFGLLLTLSGCPLHRHYMIVLFPLESLWVARLALTPAAGSATPPRLGRTLLLVLWTAQCLISAGFLTYVHDRQHLDGEYGVPYGAQRMAALRQDGRAR
jgi:hypothetical protein